jgi:alkyldihydroxyacetonephosphate synthase
VSGPRRDSKWWGWGDPAVAPELDEAALATLRERVGELQPSPRVAELGEFELPEAEPLPQALIDAVGEENVFGGVEDRIRHATGCGYADLARLRSGRLEEAPDAVLLPGNADEVKRVLALCATESVAVVPFGGGTSVVGGVAPLRGDHGRLISLDLARLRGAAVDARSLTARLGAGLRGPEAEAELAKHGLVLGH